MGVDGFWPIVSSKGKRVTLDVLSDKVIAIDASIWIYQFANALRDSTGEPIKCAHIVGFFKRICKLLYLRIKPVFVFDGPPIPLKFAALRKRHDDTVSDAMFRRAARQILLQNLRQMQANPDATPGPKPILSQSDDEDSIDEIHILTDSSSEGEGMSPSRRLRLTVPEAFRGFVAERRTLDSVSLPISPERPISRRNEYKETEIDANIDIDALKDLPLHEQYRGLLETRSALLSQGRRKALNLATKMGAAAEFSDLDQLSQEQIKAVVDLARVTDLSKAIRLEMSRDENKDEVYIPAPNTVPSSSSGQPTNPKKKRKKLNDQFYLESEFSDKHSVLSTARMIPRNELLFDKGADKVESKISLNVKAEADTSESEEDKEKLMSNLFGDEWNDLLASAGSEKQLQLVPAACKKLPPENNTFQTVNTATFESERVFTDEVENLEDEIVVPPVPLSSQKACELAATAMPNPEPSVNAYTQAMNEIPNPEPPVSENEESESAETTEEEIATSSDESIDVSSGSEEPAIEEPKTNSVGPPIVEEVHRPFHDEISDADLTMFAELADPFPFFANELEEELFDNRVREKINVVDGLENTYEEIQELLTAFGIPWVSAPADAEAQCAFLATAGLSDGVISDDSDTLIYGSPVVFRHLYIGESTVEIYRRNELGFNQEELISLALLLGCDFTVGVRGIGPVNAAEIVRHYSGIEGLTRFREWAERFVSDSDKESTPVPGEDPEDAKLRAFKITHANYRSQWLFPEDFPSQEVWDVFDKPLVDTSLEPFSWETPDERLIVEVVTSLTTMRTDEVEHLLQSTMAQYRQASLQRRITDYFSPVFERGTVAEVVSKRLKAALNKASVPS